MRATPRSEPSRPRDSAAAVDAAARAWAAKADRGLSAQEAAALEAWTAADPRRAGAYARALAALAYFDRAAALGPQFQPDRRPEARAVDRRRWLMGAGGLLAASAAGLGVFAGLSQRGRLVTRKGDIRRVALAEGSAVTLNTETAVKVDFGKDLRRIRLVRGEALFDVAKDPARPFVVEAGQVRVRAVGTSFTVRLHKSGQVGVLVREGVVEITPPDGRPQRLAADNAAAVDREVRAAAVTGEAVERATAWRDGRIDLQGMTLAAAVREFARYSDYPIRIDDPAVGAMRVTGIYSTSDPAGFARAAALSLGLALAPAGQGVALRRDVAS